MNALVNKLKDQFAGLQEREKRVVAGGALLIMAAIIYLALLPQLDRHGQLVDEQASLYADMLWLQDQGATVSRLANTCPSTNPSALAPSDSLTRLVRRNQLQLDSLRESGLSFMLAFTASDANRIVRLTHQIACAGFIVQALEVSKSSTATNTWDGSMEVQLAN